MPLRKTLRTPPAPAPDIAACAHAVEAALDRAGIRLTMGGEPTFVPLNPKGAEWSVDALGPTKLGYARRLAAALIPRLPAGAVTIETTGKRYPGEPIPRWCIQINWRRDGGPLWRNASLLRAADTGAGPHGLEQALVLGTTLAASLGLRRFCRPLVEPASAREGLGGGMVLPLDHRHGRWVSDRWPAPRGRTILQPGDSWTGLRLPMDSLPSGALRRALTVEVRDGWLVVFVPPLLFDAYAELLGVIEERVTALACGPVVLAGFLPPADDRFQSLGLAADPGVIEANLPPAASWSDYRDLLLHTCTSARETGLCPRKLHHNGRATGTGGAAHLCFGGPVAAESPFFRHPRLLPSVLRFWQRHPALSYVFSGQYVGPGSQAPRADESLHDALDQLELACQGAVALDGPGERERFSSMFRDLLADRSGNTHRAEISVDKLWNPGAPNGTLGIIEFRAFETHPDPESMAATALFVRAILCRLTRLPFRRPFREWGRALHDRFFLPTVLWSQIAGICAWLRRAGLPFDESWLRPGWEFRFPVLGRLSTSQGDIVFRQALEAWPLLSDLATALPTARPVDSSLDRIEASVPAEALERGALLVNGRRLPLRLVDGTGLAAVRYRAFHLQPGLHPHIPAQGPLTFEWVGLAGGRVQAAARYHAWHPRGANYLHLPADEQEAARRRAQRWIPLPASRGQAKTIPPLPARSRGFTLDLRHCAPVPAAT